MVPVRKDLCVIDITDFKGLFYWSTSRLCPLSVNRGFLSLNGEMIKGAVSSRLASVCSEELAEEYSFVTPWLGCAALELALP